MSIEQGRDYWTILKTLEQEKDDVSEHYGRPRLVRAHRRSDRFWVMHPPGAHAPDGRIDLDVASFAKDEELGKTIFEREEDAWAAYLASEDGPAARFRAAVTLLREEARALDEVLGRLFGTAPLAGRIPLINHARDLHDLLNGDAT